MSKKLDPRVIRTRQMLRDALMSLIPEMGYDAITVQHITDRATLNRATFYLHFSDKQDLLSQIINGVMTELASIRIEINTPPDVSEVRRVFIHLFDHVAQYAAFYRVMLHEPSVAPYVQQMQKHIETIGMSWMEHAQIPAGKMLTPPDLFICFIGSAYLAITKWWLLNGMPYSSEQMALQFMRLALGGIQREFNLGKMLMTLDEELQNG